MIQSLTDDFVNFYQAFSVESIANLGDLYAEDVVFVDPIHQVSGLESLKEYFLHLCDGDGDSYFAITDVITSGELNATVSGVGERSAFIRWQMTYNHPSLSGGKSLKLVGGSMVRFGERITYQEDFYDVGQMIYQHIPVLGWAVKKVKKHLAGGSSYSPEEHNQHSLAGLSGKTS